MQETRPVNVNSGALARHPSNTPGTVQKPKLLDRLSNLLRSRHYSRRTEQTYCHWVKRFIDFYNVRHPAEMAEKECLFSAEKRLVFLLPPVRDQTLIQNDCPIVARILFNCQRATIVEGYRHLIGLSRSIESP